MNFVGESRMCSCEPSGVRACSAASTMTVATVGKLEAFDQDTDSITVYVELSGDLFCS